MKNFLNFDEFLNESKQLSKVLYKFNFNDAYKKDGKTVDPVFATLSNVERDKAGKYAAVNVVGGYGEKELSQLPINVRRDSKEISYSELIDLIKSMKK